MELATLREEINDIDHQLVELFGRRMKIAGEVAAYKQQNNLPVLDRAREREILAQVSQQAGEGLEEYARVLYATLFDVSRSYQQRLSRQPGALAQRLRQAAQTTQPLFPKRGVVAYQGVEGAYSQQACDKLFSAPSLMSFRSFEGVFQAVEKGLCQFGVLPIENSSYGSVNAVYDLMQRYNFHIVRSIRLHIDHCLLTKPDVKLDGITEVFSHEQALGQCSAFLAAHPGIKVTVCENTAQAAQLVAQSDRRDAAAIASPDCAQLYGLETLQEHLQDRENNYTRFICIAKELAIYPGANRISLICSIPHQPGSLYRTMAKFSALELNLTKLESRPIPGRDFEFRFYFDLEASVWSDSVLSLLEELTQEDGCAFLGCYSEV